MTKKVDQLNILLLLISALLAYFFPLELFIFAFAILGPLHYLTEINWLHSKNYYFTEKARNWLLIGTIASVLIVVPKLFIEYGGEGILKSVMLWINSWSNGVIFATLMLAIGYRIIQSIVGWIILSVLIVIGAILLNDLEYYTTLIGLFVPTIIHVYLFTLLFMLYGAKKAKSRTGYLSVILLLILPFAFVVLDLSNTEFLFPDTLKSIYLENKFHYTPVFFAKSLGISDGTSFFFYESMELKLMMFVSFIYLYHYLNWFSKTTVISWHKSLSVIKSLVIAGVWILLLILFYIDFRVGFLVSLFFSMLHVILEFPLNVMSIRGIMGQSE